MARRICLAEAIVVLLANTSASSRAAAAETHLRYSVMWGGLHAADFALSMDDGETTYANTFRFKTRGIADWMPRLKVSVSGNGEAPDVTPPVPRAYRVGYTNHPRQRVVSLHFDHETGEGTRVVETDRRIDGGADPDDGDDQTEVTRDMRTGGIDPLSAFVESLRHIRRRLAGGEGEFRLAVFDGRRRFDIEGEYAGTVERTILNVRRKLHRVRMKTIPIAGFRRRHRILWDGTSFDVFLGTDGLLLPIQIMTVGPGPVMNLIEECASTCVLPEE